MTPLNELSITEAADKMRTKEISSLEITRSCLSAIEEKNADLNAFREVFEDVEVQAREADARRAKGESHPLLGIPLGIKDNILAEGRVASAGSKMLESYVAPYDATVIARLKKTGAIFLGRTNMDEFAMGSSTEHCAFGAVKNPRDTSRVPGGSSGGSAAAVAAQLALGALGSDTGGSVRQPAAFCGVVGLKPTYGAVSRFGLIALGSSLDQIGPITKSVADARTLFEAIRGKDLLDSTSRDFAPRRLERKKMKIGVPRQLLEKGVDEDALDVFESALAGLRNGGEVEIMDVEINQAELALPAYYIIMPAEASSNLARFDGVRFGLSRKGKNTWEDYSLTRQEGFGAEVRRRIILGTYVLSAGYYDAYYARALDARAALRRECNEALRTVDVIAVPTAPTPAFKLGEKADPLSMYAADVFTTPANLTGHPALSVPCGTVSREGNPLPIGLQFTAAFGDEAALFGAGERLENSTGGKRR